MIKKLLALFHKYLRKRVVDKPRDDEWDDYNPDSNKMF